MATQYLERRTGGSALISGVLTKDSAGNVGACLIDADDDLLKYYDRTNSITRIVMNTAQAQTLSNKTFDITDVETVAGAVTAKSGGGQSSATALTKVYNNVTVAAAAGDSVALPAAVVGLSVIVANNSSSPANPIQVFGNNAAGDTINGYATATGVPLGINSVAIFTCYTAGNWTVPLTQLWSTTPQVLSTAAPAIPPHTPHTYVFTRAGVVAATLAAPTAGGPGTGDDGIELEFTSDTANAHTITATGLLDTGSAAVNVATFNANKGASLLLMAYNGRWKVIAANGVSFS